MKGGAATAHRTMLVEGACEIEVIYSKRRSLALSLDPRGKVVVRCPLREKDETIEAFVKGNLGWIQKHREAAREHYEKAFESWLGPERWSEADPARRRFWLKKARELAEERLRYYAPRVGANYTKLTVRPMKTRWGSCSREGHITLNALLLSVPPFVADYVVVHELCHRHHMDHSKAFWQAVEAVLPEYKKARKWLKDYGYALTERA